MKLKDLAKLVNGKDYGYNVEKPTVISFLLNEYLRGKAINRLEQANNYSLNGLIKFLEDNSELVSSWWGFADHVYYLVNVLKDKDFERIKKMCDTPVRTQYHFFYAGENAAKLLKSCDENISALIGVYEMELLRLDSNLDYKGLALVGGDLCYVKAVNFFEHSIEFDEDYSSTNFIIDNFFNEQVIIVFTWLITAKELYELSGSNERLEVVDGMEKLWISKITPIYEIIRKKIGNP